MDRVVGDEATFWAIEFVRSPDPDGGSGGLLCMPVPGDEEECVRAALMVFESWSLAKTGLDHYLAWTGQRLNSYSLLELTARELAEVLETRPEGCGFDYVAINPILSRYFRDALGYSTGAMAEDFIEDLKGAGQFS